MESYKNIEPDENQFEKTTSSSQNFHYLFLKMTRGMNFSGTVIIIYGLVLCFTIAGALIGIPLIIAGMHLKESADHFAIFKTTNQVDFLITGFEAQEKFFRVLKFVLFVGLLLTIISILYVILFRFTIFKTRPGMAQSTL